MMGDSDEDRQIKEAITRLTVVIEGRPYVDVEVFEQLGLGIKESVEAAKGINEDWAKGTLKAIAVYEDVIKAILFMNSAGMVPDYVPDNME